MYNILIISPDTGLSTEAEVIAAASSGFLPNILSGTVTRARAIQEISTGRYEIVHFATHGKEHVLEMTDGIIEEEMLEHAVRQAGTVKALFLNACKSAHTAVEVYNHTSVSYSIGWPFDVEDAVALTWAKLFYEALRIAPGEIKRAAEVASESVVKSHHIDPDKLPIVLNGRVVQVMEECQHLRAELHKAGVLRLPMWVIFANVLLIALLIANLLILSAKH